MRILVISDIHSNATALQAVLEDAGSVDQVWCLGDVIGYGPDPNEVVALLNGLSGLTCMMGNHDAAVVGRMPMAAFNNDARSSLNWHKEVINADTMRFLDTLQDETRVVGDVSLVHGSPRDPIWEYVINTLIARLNFEVFNTNYCFVGHSHVQGVFQLDISRNRISVEVPPAGRALKLTPRAILNPGSVGQPRDRDPRAAYAIFDPEAETWTPRRAAYDVAAVQGRIRAAGLPDRHAARLDEGW